MENNTIKEKQKRHPCATKIVISYFMKNLEKDRHEYENKKSTLEHMDLFRNTATNNS